jgi:hypothetical protein
VALMTANEYKTSESEENVLKLTVADAVKL